MTKKRRIKNELERLKQIFSGAGEDRLEAAASLMENAAFMKVTLEDLQEVVNREGVVEEYQNGANQHGMKQSATLQSYNALIKNYAGVMKTLAQILPNRPVQYVYDPHANDEPEETEEEKQQRYDEVARQAHELRLKYAETSP